MSTALLVMTDGRDDLLEQTLVSFFEKVTHDISFCLIHDDSANRAHHEALADLVYDDVLPVDHVAVHTTAERLGFGGAIRNAWEILAEKQVQYGYEWVFHLEDDFLFNRPVDLLEVQDLLIEYSYLAQMALKRQPWGSDYEYTNGFMEKDPGAFTQFNDVGYAWVETVRNWTTNPALYRVDLVFNGWPEDPHSEGKYGFVLKEHGLPWGIAGGDVRFGIYGRIEDAPLVHHIGGENGVSYRVGTGY